MYITAARPTTNTDTDPSQLGTSSSPKFPAPKTDKPRPHICGTCQRSFARLEHLKRHERSHTKEKPFECPECTRCFARRDLLLRHQQKLHMSATAPSKPRGGRRESTTSMASNQSSRVRKNSIAGSSAISASMRPRANTISHIDAPTLGMLGNKMMPEQNFNVNSFRQQQESDFHAIPQAMNGHGQFNGLPRLATHGLGMGIGAGLRTAPPGQNMGSFGFESMLGPGPTVNPAQLQLSDLSGGNTTPFGVKFPQQFTPQPAIMEDENGYDWMRGFSSQMSFDGNHEHGNGSLGNGMHASSHAEMNDHFDMNQSIWSQQMMQQQQNAMNFQMEAGLYGFQQQSNGTATLSPHAMQPMSGQSEPVFSTPPPLNSLSPMSINSGMPLQYQHPLAFSSDGTSNSSSSINGSARNSSVTSYSTDSITDITRTALITSLSQPSTMGLGQRKYSTPHVSSPLSSNDQMKPLTGYAASLPSTQDLQRFVSAYIQYFHPHFPFLHIPTLSFDTPAYTSDLQAANSHAQNAHAPGGIVGGGGCLILAMAAIGALYEFDRQGSRELFEASKRMIQLYLEERRKADSMPTSTSNPRVPADLAAQNTPLWLVQAMLLNVIYGHNCGDKTAGDIASTHCTALVSLARSAELVRPLSDVSVGFVHQANGHGFYNGDVHMNDDFESTDPWNASLNNPDEQAQWYKWLLAEERKRTLFAIYHMSSLLVSAYNHAPALMNSEIQLDLPCDEDLWCAASARVWAAKGGAQLAEQRALPFTAGLSTLLSASHEQNEHHSMIYRQPFGSGMPLAQVPRSDLKPSTFGCLVLIDALHNYIWETRQRHSGRHWTTQETESMHAHIEPALRAWQAAWASNPSHSLERPNPYGLGPLSADSIPLLDLAYVRLFVNLGTSKEAFWQRDFHAMAEELARGSEIIQHADHSDNSTNTLNTRDNSRNSPDGSGETKVPLSPSSEVSQVPASQEGQSSKRERHLRKAAFYAADSLSMSDKLGVTFADFNSRELPVQSALCAFDCAQVLAEWVVTVQERVGRYLGVLGRDNIDLSQVPAIMLLEDEDCKLLEKIGDILIKAESKITHEIRNMDMSSPRAMEAIKNLPSATQEGFGSKVLKVMAVMLDKAAVWPGKITLDMMF